MIELLRVLVLLTICICTYSATVSPISINGKPSSTSSKSSSNTGAVPSSKLDDPIRPIDSMNSAEKTWLILEDSGEMLTRYSKISLLGRSICAGLFVGFGGILCSSVGFDIDGLSPWDAGNGLARLLSGLFGFPLSILLITLTNCGAWTGDMLLVARAMLSKEKNVSIQAFLRTAVITWFGCLIGTILMALLACGAQLPACHPAIMIAQHKLGFTALQTFLRAVGGGSLICLAVFMSKVNRDMTGKVLSILFPISTYVICDFEHVLASMFFLSCAKVNGANISILEIFKFLIPSTLGNLVGGGILVSLMSFIPQELRKSVSSI